MTSKEQIEEILKKENLTLEDHKILEDYEPNDGANRLYSFFTPIWLCEVMYKLAIKNGFNEKTGLILEPASGTGNFIKVLKHPENCTAFELDNLNYQIAKKRVPKIKEIYNNYFETAFLQPERFALLINQKKEGKPTWLTQYPFDLVIGNPPYGKYKNMYSTYFRGLKFKQVEMFFMYKSLELLKSGGLLVFITASSFMRNNDTYKYEKEMIGELADFVDAYRMPKVFKNTAVPTDILIFRKK
jgi:type I restriction-modification system DNA methylase subunit